MDQLEQDLETLAAADARAVPFEAVQSHHRRLRRRDRNRHLATSLAAGVLLIVAVTIAVNHRSEPRGTEVADAPPVTAVATVPETAPTTTVVSGATESPATICSSTPYGGSVVSAFRAPVGSVVEVLPGRPSSLSAVPDDEIVVVCYLDTAIPKGPPMASTPSEGRALVIVLSEGGAILVTSGPASAVPVVPANP